MKPIFLILISGITLASCKSKTNNEKLIEDIKTASSRNVRTYNELEEEKAKAVQEGDITSAAILQASMDSIMISNAQLGDSLIRMQAGK